MVKEASTSFTITQCLGKILPLFAHDVEKEYLSQRYTDVGITAWKDVGLKTQRVVSYKMRTREMQSMTQFLQVKADGWVSVKEHQFYYWDDDRTELTLESKIYLETLPIFQYATYSFFYAESEDKENICDNLSHMSGEESEEEECVCKVSMKTEYRGHLLCKDSIENEVLSHLQQSIANWRDFISDTNNEAPASAQQQISRYQTLGSSDGLENDNGIETNLQKIKMIVEENKVRLLQTNANLQETRRIVVAAVEKEIEERLKPSLDRLELLLQNQREEDMMKRKREEERRVAEEEWRKKIERVIENSEFSDDKQKWKWVGSLLRWTSASLLLVVWPIVLKSVWRWVITTSQGTRALRWLLGLVDLFLSVLPRAGKPQQTTQNLLTDKVW